MPELIPAEPGTPGWLAARRQGVTATDIVTILGLSTYDSVYSLFWRKLGQVPDTEDNDRFRLGRELESYVAARWTEANSRALGHGHLWRHSERSWQMAATDRGVQTGTSVRPVELKTWADADRHAWDDAPPARVRAQVLWQMDVMDVAAGHVGVVFLPSGEFRSYVIDHGRCCGNVECDHEALECVSCRECIDIELMRTEAEMFMARLRLELPPPDPDASAATLAAVRARFAKAPDKETDVDAALYQQWHEAKEISDYYDDEAGYLETLLREQAGEASVLTVDGQPVARRVVSDAQVKAHTRHMDYLRRITPRGDDSE